MIDSARPVKVVTFYDEMGWAWWHRAHHIRAHLSPAVELTILRNGTPFDPEAFDLVMLFEHYLLNLVPSAPRGKVILGSSCPRLTHEMVERLLREKCLAGMVNNLEAHRRFAGQARMYCCQNGVDADLFSPAPALPASPQACWVGNSKSIGNKGLDLIREACRRAGVPLLVLDKAELGGEGAALTQEQVRDSIYRRSTFYVCASEFEGTPNPMLESLACGLPVISTRVGNAPEILRDGHNGFLADRTADSLETAIRRLLRQDAAELSRNARLSILDGWTWKHRAAPYEAMFLDLAREASAAASPRTSARMASAPAPAAPAAPAPEKKQGFTGMVAVPFLAPRAEEKRLYLADLREKAESLRRKPDDFDAVLGAALDAIRLGDYALARDFAACAAGLTRYYNEVIRDMSLHIRCRERKLGKPPAADPARALGGGTIRIAMLTYNALEYTRQCLHSLLTRTRRPLEIHIRENASKDDTPRWLRELDHPRIHVEFGEENRGVPGGRNRLIEMIRPVAHPDDFVVFLDNDIEVLEGWEDHFLEFFGSHPGVGIASALGQRMTVEAMGRSLREPPYENPEPVDVALGGYACWMRAGAMLEVGGYDENLGLFWHEDDDFCVRAISKGIDVWAVPGAPLIHHGHKSGVALSGLSQGGSPKNLAYLADKWRRLGIVLPTGEIDRGKVRERQAAPRQGYPIPAPGPAPEAATEAASGARSDSKPHAASVNLPADGAPAGFTVFGRFGSPSGTPAGRIARALASAGHPVSLAQCGERVPLRGDADLEKLFLPDGAAGSHPINLFLLNPPDLEALRAKGGGPGTTGAFDVVLPSWPFRIPDAWIPSLDRADLVLAASREFLADASARLGKATVRYAPPLAALAPELDDPAGPRADGRAGRVRWGLPESAVVFGIRFDVAGDLELQDPMDAIQAFIQAFPDRDGAVLCVQVENAGALPRYREFVEGMREVTRSHANVRYVTEALPPREALSLAACWDVAVSLRRAGAPDEALLAAMSLGKPALALGLAGNLDILHEGNAFLAKHVLEPAEASGVAGEAPAGERLLWGRPDVEDIAEAMRRLSGDAALRRELGARARADMARFIADFGAAEVFRRVESAWRRLRKPAVKGSGWMPGPRGPSGAASGLRVLFQNRPTAEAAPGGDTMVMDRYREGLERLGAVVDVRHDPGADYRRYDIVHLYNLVLPATIEPLARAARSAGVPYVVQAIQEDQAGYQGRALAMARALAAYVERGQPREALAAHLEAARRAEAKATDSSAFAAAHAAALLCNSAEEAGYVRRLHPDARCVVNPYGVDAPREDIGPEDFEKAFGARDFLLCVGRLETRKNQLALLAALEDEDLTLVLADGGVCYMPGYAEACRRFRRRGRTLFTGRMSREMLVSCYRAARAHILPSWQELPGLVTLEAALLGCNVAATPHGGIREYMGDACAYFEPDDLDGMRAAARAAMAAPRAGRSGGAARGFTWERSVDGVLASYRAALSRPAASAGAAAPSRATG